MRPEPMTMEQGSKFPNWDDPFGYMLGQFVEGRTDKRASGYAISDFIRWWNWQEAFTERRWEVLSVRPPLEDLSPIEQAAVGSVVLSLCVRDSVEPPEWLEEIKKLDSPRASVYRNMHLEMVEWFMKDSPRTCYRYNFFIEDRALREGAPGEKHLAIKETFEMLKGNRD